MEYKYKANAKNILDIYSDLIKKENYANSNIICYQFNLWINVLLYMKEVHNTNGIKCVNLYKYFSDYTVKSRLDNDFYLRKKYSFLLLYILKIIPIPYAVLSGGILSLFDKYIYFLTYVRLTLIKPQINHSLRNTFIKNLKLLNIDNYQYIVDIIPDSFFYQQFSKAFIPRKVLLSSDNLFKDDFCHISFANKCLKLVGIQHGGFTLEAKHNLFHEFDLNVTSEMIYWGLGDKNITQKRYKLKKNSQSCSKYIYVVSPLKVSPVLSFFLCDLGTIQNDININRKVLEKNIKFYILDHPREKNLKSNSTTLDMLDNKKLNSAIYILDAPFHTFFYRAVYQDLRILLYFNPKWKPFYTQQYCKLIRFLRFNELLFFWGEEELLKQKIVQLQNSKKNIYSNSIIRNYLYRDYI